MNMIDIQDKLKNLSEDQLIREMQAPSGQAPQFLVLSEITRRKKMRDGFKAQEAKQGVPSVAEEVIASAGVPQQGMPGMAQAMAPKSSIAQNTGIGSLQPQRMASGGLVQKMADGGRIVVRNGQRFIQTEDGRLIPQTRSMSMLENLQGLPEEIAAIPGQLGSAARDFSAGFADRMNADLQRTGDEAMRRQMAEDVYGMRAGPDTSYRYPDVPTVDTSAMDRVAAAFSRTGPITGMPTPQQLAMEAAQPRLPPAPLPAFGPDFEYGGRGPAVDLDLTQPTDFIGPRALTPEQMALMQSAQPNMPPPDAGLLLPPTPPQLDTTGLDRRAQFEPQGDGLGLAYLPPEVDPEYFARQSIAARPITDILSSMVPEVMTRAEGEAAIAKMAEEDARASRALPMTYGTPLTGEDLLPPEATQDGETPDKTAPQGTSEAPLQALSDVVGGGGAGTGQGGSGGAAGASGSGGYISELEDALKRAERTKEQDKWLALAQAGMALMASDQPTLGGALGEAGQVGIEAFRSARDTYDESRMSIMEAIAAQKAAAARAAGAGRGGGTPSIDKYLRSLDMMREGLMTKGTNQLGEEIDVAIPGAAGYIDEIDRRKLEAISLGLGGFRPVTNVSQIQ